MGKPQAPAAPDPVKTAGAQTASNISTALAQQQLNATDQVGPQGSVKYSNTGQTYDFTDPGTGQVYKLPKMQQTTTLSPEQQRLYDTGQATTQNLANIANSQSGRLGNILNSEIDYSGVPALQTSFDRDWSADRTKVEDALYSRLNPQMTQQTAALETQLSNQGIKKGTTLYDRELEKLRQSQNDQRTSVLLAGGQEQSRLAGLDQAAAAFGNNARTQSLSELYAKRQAPINEIIGLSSGTQVANPSYAPTAQTGLAGTDIAGINQGAANTAQAQYQSQLAQYNSTAGGLFGLGASALMAFSDRDLKTDIRDTGEEIAGVPIKTWRWKGSDQRDTGVIAQELEKKHPELVDKSHPSGFRRVNYGKLMSLGASAQQRKAA